jgi:hypothetical protein
MLTLAIAASRAEEYFRSNETKPDGIPLQARAAVKQTVLEQLQIGPEEARQLVREAVLELEKASPRREADYNQFIDMVLGELITRMVIDRLGGEAEYRHILDDRHRRWDIQAIA